MATTWAKTVCSCICALALGLPAGAGARTGDVPGRLVVTLVAPDLPDGDGPAAREAWHDARARSRELIDRVATRNGITDFTRIPELGALVVEHAAPGLRSALEADPRVATVEADGYAELRRIPSDVGYVTHDPNAPNDDFGQWNLRKVKAQGAWDISRGVGAEVAVIDTGADGTNPDLAPRIAGSSDQDPTTITGALFDEVGHGTHVAGLACADSDSPGNAGIASLGFDCDLYIVKTELTYSAIALSIVDATNRGSDAINLSLGGCGPSAALRTAVDYAWSRGVVVVAAAKNIPDPDCPGDTDQGYPARYVQPTGTGSDLNEGKGLVVTAARYTGQRAPFGGYGTGVTVGAFGSAFGNGSTGQEGILSTWPQAIFAPSDDYLGVRTSVGGNPDYAYLEGTSMATPQVAGLVALMRSADQSLSAARVVRLIKLTSSGRGSFDPEGLGWGLINAHQAVAAAAGRDINPPVSKVRTGGRDRRGRLVLRVKRFEPESADFPRSRIRKAIVFVAVDGGKAHRVIKTLRRKIKFATKAGHVYAFHTVAIDRAGNREAAPSKPDAVSRT